MLILSTYFKFMASSEIDSNYLHKIYSHTQNQLNQIKSKLILFQEISNQLFKAVEGTIFNVIFHVVSTN